MKKYNAIVVLAAGIQKDGSLASNAQKRVEKAIELYKQKHAPYIIMPRGTCNVR